MGLRLYNTLTRTEEEFTPVEPDKVKMYVCGPTVYSDAHVGHAMAAIVFDMVRRYLIYKGYDVRYATNFTDVDDKIINRANKTGQDPIALANHYAEEYLRHLRDLNILTADVYPRVSSEMDEIIRFIQGLISSGYAYPLGGDVYFRVTKDEDYGKLSRRTLDEAMSGTRVEEDLRKENTADFALWKGAKPGEPAWDSPWGPGRPGWHIECSAMSRKYLGDVFDIHGGGMDLLFPHHESEIAQSTACTGHNPARFWVHHNMITINGQKMAKSLGNGITVEQLFSGDHPLLAQAYSPMTLRFFILQAHYRGTLDFSNEALQASEKGLQRLWKAAETAGGLKAATQNDCDVHAIAAACRAAMNDDLNTPQVIAQLFEAARVANLCNDGKLALDAANIQALQQLFKTWMEDILGIRTESSGDDQALDGVMQMLLDMRAKAKADKNYALSDEIRNRLNALGLVIRDGKEGSSWSRN